MRIPGKFILLVVLIAVALVVCIVAYNQISNDKNNEGHNDSPIDPETLEKYNLFLDVTEGGQASGAGLYNAGNTVLLEATPENGYNFKGWYEDNIILSSDKSYQLVLDSDRTIKAIFERSAYRITVTTNYDNAGVISGDGLIPHNSITTLTTTVSSGFEFEGWYDGRTLLSDETSFEYRAIKDVTLLCKFSVIEDPSFTLSPPSSNAPCTITAYPKYYVGMSSEKWSIKDDATGIGRYEDITSGYGAQDGEFIFTIINSGTFTITHVVNYTNGSTQTYETRVTIP